MIFDVDLIRHEDFYLFIFHRLKSFNFQSYLSIQFALHVVLSRIYIKTCKTDNESPLTWFPSLQYTLNSAR